MITYNRMGVWKCVGAEYAEQGARGSHVHATVVAFRTTALLRVFRHFCSLYTSWARTRFAAQCDFRWRGCFFNSSFQGLMSQASGVRNCHSRF